MRTYPGKECVGPARVLDVKAILGARLAPDGTEAVFAVSAISEDRCEDRVHLSVVDVGSGESRELTSPDAVDTAPAWLPDKSAVLFHSTRSERPQIYRVDLASREITQISDAPFGAGSSGPAVSPSGAQIAFWAPSQEPADRSLPYRITDGVWRLDGVGRLDLAVMDLFVMPIAGGEARQLTDRRAVPVGAPKWSPDGERLLYLSFRSSDAPRYELRVIDLSNGSDSLIWDSAFQAFPPAATWLPDGRIVRSTENLVVPQGEPLDIVVSEARAGAPVDIRTAGVETWFFGFLQGESGSLQMPRLVVAPDGKSVFAAAQDGGCVEAWSISTDGPEAPRRIIGGDQTTVVLDASEGKLLLAISTMHEPFDLWLSNYDGSRMSRLTKLNEAMFGPERYFTVHSLDVVGRDGADVEAWFLAPRGSGGAVPTILTNHGGPHAGWGHIFQYDVAMLAAAGYGTLLVNGRGSTGYSREFARVVHGDFGNLDISDLELALDSAISLRLADKTRLGVRGASFGGFSTAWIATHTNRFKCAVIESGHLDLNAQLGADIGYVMFPGWMTGGPRDRTATATDHAELSPTTFAENCTTPLLVIQHEQDLRCPATNGDLMFALLKAAGRNSEMLRLPLTAHSGLVPATSHNGSGKIGSPVTRVAVNEALLDWITKYLDEGALDLR